MSIWGAEKWVGAGSGVGDSIIRPSGVLWAEALRACPSLPIPYSNFRMHVQTHDMDTSRLTGLRKLSVSSKVNHTCPVVRKV